MWSLFLQMNAQYCTEVAGCRIKVVTLLYWLQRGNKQRIWPDPVEAGDWGWTGRDGRGSHRDLQQQKDRVWGCFKEACRTGQGKGKSVLYPVIYRMCIKENILSTDRWNTVSCKFV